jgi:rod shape-determining protein MreB
MVGGGALLRGLDQVLAKATGLDVMVTEDPLTCVARGTSEYLDYLDDWQETLESDADEY